MYQDNSQRAYAQGFGTINTNYPVVDQRDPTVNDVNYLIGKFWLNNSTMGLWYLNSQSNVMSSENPTGMLQSLWILISRGNALVSLSDTADTVVFPSPPSATPPDNIQLIASTGLTIVSNPSSNSITFTNTGIATETHYTSVDFVMSPYTVLPIDDYISVDCSAGPVTLLFPNSPTLYETWTVKDRFGYASTNNISITTVGGTVLFEDYQTTYTINSNYGAVNLIWNGTFYEVW